MGYWKVWARWASCRQLDTGDSFQANTGERQDRVRSDHRRAPGDRFLLLSSALLAMAVLTIGFIAYSLSATGRQLLIQRHTPPEITKSVGDAFSLSLAICFLIGMAGQVWLT